MEDKELKDLIRKVADRKYESQMVEVKAARKGCPARIYDTLSSFSNQDGGGVILFGIDEKNDYELCGVYDVADLQLQLKNHCEAMSPTVRAFFTAVNIDGKDFLSMEVPGLPAMERTCFYKPKGRYAGSYVRVGEADMPMSEFEVFQYESYKKHVKNDTRVIDDNEIKLFNEEKHRRYLGNVKKLRPNLANNVPDNEIDTLMGLMVNGKPTLASTMVFSEYPQAYFPQYSILATKIDGTEITDLGLDGERFQDSERITGPIDTMANLAMDFVKRNIRYKTIINGDGNRVNKPEYPLVAVREAINNALIHRDYSVLSEGMPVRIEIYNDRIEIINPGQIYGGGNVESLGRERLETRNMVLADILEILEVTENRYSGIPTIRRQMRDNNLPQPVFLSARGEFKVILRNAFDLGEKDLASAILDYCSTPRSRDEICAFVKKSKNYVVSKYILPLVLSGQLKLTLPDKPQSPHQKYQAAESKPY